MSTRRIVLILSFVIVVSLVLVALPYTFTFFANSKIAPNNTLSQNQTAQDKTLLNTDLKRFQQFATDSSQETQDSYIATVNNELADTSISPDTRKLLLLRKAILMSFPRKDPAQHEQSMEEADTILKGFIDSTSTAPTDVYVRDYALETLPEMYIECCYSIYLSKGSTVINTIYSAYLAQGYNPEIAKYLTLNDLSKLISPARQGDQFVTALSILLESDLITFESKDLKPSTRAALLKQLGTNVANYPNTKQFIVKSTNPPLEANLQYVTGFDVYNSISGKESKVMDAQIDTNYETEIKNLSTETIDGGSVASNLMLAYIIPRYMYSMERRYGSGMDKNKFNSLITQDFGYINFSKETQAFFKQIYLEEGNRMYAGTNAVAVAGDSALYTPFYYRYFVGLAKTHTDIADYLASIGVTK